MQSLGRHVIVELSGCDPAALNQLQAVKEGLVEAARRAQATIVATTFHQFSPVGISGIVVISESHLSIHTWPEHGYAAVDVFSCGRSLDAGLAVDYLVERFGAKHVAVVELQRGTFPQGLTARLAEPAVAAAGCPTSTRRWRGLSGWASDLIRRVRLGLRPSKHPAMPHA